MQEDEFCETICDNGLVLLELKKNVNVLEENENEEIDEQEELIGRLRNSCSRIPE